MEKNKAAPEEAEKNISNSHSTTNNIRQPCKLDITLRTFLAKGDQEKERACKNVRQYQAMHGLSVEASENKMSGVTV
ncbi:MAG: hypothetical protein H6999_00060 [Hahellaceae bacterium]|nr:hypothetical protein [Hahellaceae bacterium]MCP5168144.1 hypothetical protein [Hahellaceae bacterium]